MCDSYGYLDGLQCLPRPYGEDAKNKEAYALFNVAYAWGPGLELLKNHNIDRRPRDPCCCCVDNFLEFRKKTFCRRVVWRAVAAEAREFLLGPGDDRPPKKKTFLGLGECPW